MNATPSRPFIGILLLLMSLIAGPLVAVTPAAAIGEAAFANPIEPDTADPTIEFYEGNYYMVATTWDNRVVMRKSPTLAALGTATPVTVYTDTNPGRNANMWAPELQRLSGPNGWRWYLMYTMGTAGGFGAQHLQVIESAGDDPMGPYNYKARPLPIDDWNIDGAYLQLNGELFMTWSQFAPDGLQSNYIARMSNPWTAIGPLNILSQPVEPWETIGAPVNEGPIPLQRDGRTWIVYSASFCGTEDYQLGTLEYDGTGDPVLATSWKKSNGPVFSKANGEFGTGHNDFFTSPDGTQTWNLYHANARPDGGCARQRSARAHIVDWTAAGEPAFGTPLGAGVQIPVPSGENAPITAHVKGAPWVLVNRVTGQCATVSSAASGDGAAVVQGSCDSPRATWVLDPTADGYLRVVNASSGKSLGPAACSTVEAAGLQQSAWITTSCQQWSISEVANGYSKLTNRTSGKVLDSVGNTGVRQSTASSSASQEWALRPSGPVAVTSFVTGKAFDLPSCSTTDGAVLQQYEWLGSPCQRVTFTATAGDVQMHPVSAATKCLAVSGGSTADGAAVTQGSCSATGSNWRLLPRNDGTVELRATHSGKSLDLSNCAAANGTRIGQWSVLNNDCQRFRISLGAPETPRTLQLTATTSARCVAGKVVLMTAVKNTDDLPADITIGSGTTAKTYAAVAGGKTVSTAVTTRQTSLTAGSVTVSGTGVDDPRRAITTAATYPSIDCG